MTRIVFIAFILASFVTDIYYHCVYENTPMFKYYD